MAIEIVDSPINSMVDLSSSLRDSLPGRVTYHCHHGPVGFIPMTRTVDGHLLNKTTLLNEKRKNSPCFAIVYPLVN